MSASQSTTSTAETFGETEPANSSTDWADEKLKPILESLLFAAGEPVSLAQLANALEEVPRERIRRTLCEMAAAYANSGRGLTLEEIAGGYQLRTPREHAVYVRRLLSAKPPRLSRALLETLAIVAYRQPITRPEIEQLRGVDSGGVVDTLVERNLIRITGRKEAPGRPIVYSTTADFLELFGLKNLESLPDLEEFRELEGLQERVDAATPPADSQESHESEAPPQAESAEHKTESEPPASATNDLQQSIDTANDGTASPREDAVSPTGTGEPITPKANGGNEY